MTEEEGFEDDEKRTKANGRSKHERWKKSTVESKKQRKKKQKKKKKKNTRRHRGHVKRKL